MKWLTPACLALAALGFFVAAAVGRYPAPFIASGILFLIAMGIAAQRVCGAR